jgi:hyaluronate lyase
MSVNRRTALRGGAIAAASVALASSAAGTAFASTASVGAAANTDTTTGGAADPASIVKAYRELQAGINRPSPERAAALVNLDRVAKAYNASMTVTGDQLWADLPKGPGSNSFPSMYGRLRAISVNWATPGGALYHDPTVLARVKAALEILYVNQYNENTDEIGNWYSYEIGVPYYLLHSLVSVSDQLTAAELTRYLQPVLRFTGNPNIRTNNPTLAETGANRGDKALIAVVSGALLSDTVRIAKGIDAITDVVGGGSASLVGRVTKGDGYHPDGSFIQHDVIPYAGHYGLVLLTAFAGLIHVTDGTAYALNADLRQKIYDTVADTYAPFVFAGSMMEPVRGRMLSRQGETAHDAGKQLTGAVVLLALSAPDATKKQLSGLVAEWIGENKFAPYYEIPDPERFSPGPDLVAIPGIEFGQELLSSKVSTAKAVAVNRVYGQQDRIVHVTENWSASLGVASTRICRYESVNGQNLHGWYVGDGVLYTFQPKSQGHYTDVYWPTVDPTLLPGATSKAGTPPKPPTSGPLTPNPHTGGVRWDDRHGAYALDLITEDGTLTAKKSWFFTPEGIVCLGAGITDTSGAEVRTAIENRNLGENGSGSLTADFCSVPVTPGRSTALRRPRWLHLDGVGGYVVLDGSDVTALREDRTGSWRDVDTGANTKGTTVPYTRRYQKLVLSHGVNPAGASYAYAVLPTASRPATVASSLAWRVRSNTATSQAIRLWDSTLLANFFAAGSVEELTVSGPASVAVGRTRSGWKIAVSDPTQLQTSIEVTVRRKSVDVPVAGTFGATQVVSLAD